MVKKYYILRKGSKDTDSTFTGKSPRQAALKAARRGINNIMLRQRGRKNIDNTYSVHIFKGSVKWVKAREDKPDWLPDKIRQPVVKKVKVDRIKKL